MPTEEVDQSTITQSTAEDPRQTCIMDGMRLTFNNPARLPSLSKASHAEAPGMSSAAIGATRDADPAWRLTLASNLEIRVDLLHALAFELPDRAGAGCGDVALSGVRQHRNETPTLRRKRSALGWLGPR